MENIEKVNFDFPPIWDDDARMNALFAPFRPKTINPVEWESKLKFWEALIEQYCFETKQFNTTLEKMKRTFSRKGKVPTCLLTVFEEMYRCGHLVPVDSYKNYSLVTESYRIWATRLLVKTPLQWAVNKVLSPFGYSTDISTCEFVHITTVKKLSEELIGKISAKSKGTLFNVKEVIKIADLKDEDTLKLILRPLIEEKRVAVTVLPDAVLMKFAIGDEKVSPISEIDIGIYDLMLKEELLVKNIDELEEEKVSALKQVKVCLASNKRQTAKNWLRRKNALEGYIDKRSNALDNIRNLLDKIHQAESDNMILDAYKQGITALKETFKTKGLTEEKAEDTMVELEDVLDIQKDIETTLSRTLDPEADSTLEEELAELMMDSAPDVPPCDPNTSGESGKPVVKENVEDKVKVEKPAEVDKLDKDALLLPDVPSNSNIDDLLEARIKALAL